MYFPCNCGLFGLKTSGKSVLYSKNKNESSLYICITQTQLSIQNHEMITHIKHQFPTLSLHHVHLLLAVSAAGPVTSNGNCSHGHQKDDHHVVVQHRLIGCVHGNQSSFTKGLWEIETGLNQGTAKDFVKLVHTKVRSNLTLLSRS